MKKLLLFLICVTCSFAQIELMQNSYPTNPSGVIFPDGTVDLIACLTGSATGVNNVPIILDYHQYLGWGGHVHEINGPHRPEPVILGSKLQLSGNSGNPPGCVSWQVQFVGYAGGYTFTASSPGFPVRGINYITRQYVVNGLRTPQYFVPYVGLADNQTYDLHIDTLHLPASSRFISPDVASNVHNLSTYYKALTLNQTGFIEVLDITRISLPDGGIYDNDINGFAPGPDQSFGAWNTRAFEEHARGNEIDMVVPIGNIKQDLAFASITTAGCYLGKFTPNGAPIFNPNSSFSPETQYELYWRARDIMHVSCKSGRSLKSNPKSQ